MKTFYLIKKFLLIIIALLIITAASAQEATYASLNKQPGAVEYSSAVKKNIIESVIKIKARTANKIVLNWAPFQGAVSHYVVERSTDGRRFQK